MRALLLAISLTFVLIVAMGPPSRAQSAPVSSPSLKEQAPTEAACSSLREKSAQAISKRDYAAATTLLRRELLACTGDADISLKLAKAEMLSKQFDASAKTLDSLLAHDPRNVEALMTQGELFYLVGKSADAVASLLKAIAAAPAKAEPHYLLGRVYYEASSLALARPQFQTALQLDANAYKAYDGLALCYENLGDTTQAAETYMKGIALVYKAHPEYDVIYADFAELMLRFNENQKALDLAGEAVERNPHTPRNYLLVGRALKQEGKYQDSLRWLLRAAQMDPAYPDPHFQLSRIYRKLGDETRSREQADLFAKLSAQAPQVRR